jgi:hypothetical protein
MIFKVFAGKSRSYLGPTPAMIVLASLARGTENTEERQRQRVVSVIFSVPSVSLW